METRGIYAPATGDEVRDYYAAAGPAAQTVTREVARAMGFDGDEYDRRVTSDVVETARDAVFASLLEVGIGPRSAFEDECDDRPGYEVIERGSSDVDRVAWHVAPAAETVLAATFQDETDAAAATVRRLAFGRVYASILDDG